MLMIYYNESYLYLDACNLEIVLIMFDIYLSKHTKREGKNGDRDAIGSLRMPKNEANFRCP